MESLNQILTSDGGLSAAIKYLFNDLYTEPQKAGNSFLERICFSALNKLNEAILIIDAESKIVYQNKTSEELFEINGDKALGKSLFKLTKFSDPLSGESFIFPNNYEKKDKFPNTETFFQELLLITNRGSQKLISLKTLPIGSEDDIIGCILIAADISIYSKMENELLKTQQLQTTRVFIGGIAHDFNNILTSIMGNISLAQLFADDIEKMIQKITSAEKACERAQDLSAQLLNYSKEGLPNIKTTLLRDIIEESVRFVIHGSKIECKFDLENQLYPVDIDNNQMCQVLNNLIINAIQAMPDGGKVSISAKNIPLKPSNPFGLKSGNYIKLSIADNGCGISEENQKRIFEPFFTTKIQGSGLGLTSCLKIILNHNGCMKVKSVLGLGSTFTIYLPASNSNLKEIPDTYYETEFKGSGRILIMDDNQELSNIAGNMLNLFGFHTDLACNEKEAYRLYRKSISENDKYKIVIIDLTIPGSEGGLEALNQLKTIDKKVVAILTTGYSKEKWQNEYKKYGFKAFLAKPYRIYTLLQAIKRLVTATC